MIEMNVQDVPQSVDSADTDRLVAMESGVAEVLPVLPIVCRQLTESAEHVERAVVEVCADFQAISDRSRGSVERASRCLDQSDGKGVRQLADSARSTITSLLERAEEAHTRLIETAARVEAVEREVRRIEDLARKVDKVSSSIKILSINARIEAARAGAAGKAFAVVAGETGKVSTDAAEMNKAIQDVTRRLSQEVRSIAEEIRDRVAQGRGDVESARTEVGGTFGMLSEASEDLRLAVEEAAKDAKEVARSVGRAVMALQFQDTVSQRVAHAVGTLQEIGADLAQYLASDIPDSIGNRWAGRLSSKFTMAAEHEALHGGDTGTSAGNIELF